jgi:3-dehydroquinate synthetase
VAEISRVLVGADKPYPVVIGRSLLDEVPKFLEGAKKVLVVHPAGLAVSAEQLRDFLITQGFDVVLAGVPDNEEAKRIEVALGEVAGVPPEHCWVKFSDTAKPDLIIPEARP